MELINVEGHLIGVDKDGFICLTDIAKRRDRERPADIIKNWLKTQSTVEFLTAWEQVNNPNFKVVDLHHFTTSYNMSIPAWTEKTDAIGIYSRMGKQGGTYAHKDIAFEFGAAISPMFKLHLIREYQRLREQEQNRDNPQWIMYRHQCKVAYHIQTDAVKAFKIPFQQIPLDKHPWAYAEEADVLNKALFGFTARQWREHNTELAGRGHNLREFASINQLTILTALESMNAEMMKSNLPVGERLRRLTKIAAEQIRVLNDKAPLYSLPKATDGSFQPLYQEDNRPFGMFPQLPYKEYAQRRLNKAS